MKKRFYFAALVAAMALASCTERNADIVESGEMVELMVNVPCLETKVSGNPQDEGKVSDLQIFVFNKDSGILESYGHASTSSMKLSCVPGSKEIVALVNAPSLSDIATLSELQEKKSSLEDNASGRLVMSGQMTRNITPSDNAATVNVSRLAAKVTLINVNNQMSLEVNKQKEFVVTAVYMINAVGDRAYLSSSTPGSTYEVWYNKMMYETGCPDFLYDAPKVTIPVGQAYSTQHHFYCYPNMTLSDANDGTWSARKTRLVVEATLGGETCYYPVTMSNLAQNTSYTISLTVTRPGSSSPDIPITTNEATISVNVKQWIDGVDYNETI